MTGVLAAVMLAGCGGDAPPAIRTATGPAPLGAITFAGWHWTIKTAGSPVGPGPNRFGSVADGNVRLDERGRLHLAITRRTGAWYSAEVVGTEETGYGTYTWTIEAPATPAEPNAVLGLFTWSDAAEHNHREIDIELSQFRRPDGDAVGQYVVQPHETAGNLQQITGPLAAPATVRFTWKPGEVEFAAAGATPDRWTYRGPDVPTAGGGVHPQMNLWLLAGDPPANDLPVEVVISSFTYAPLTS